MNILQFGCFGTNNYGDEMGAVAMRRMIRQVYPDAEITMLGSRGDLIAKNHKDLTDYATWGGGIEQLMDKTDLWIIGPGTILGTALMPIARELKLLKKPYMLWGVSAAEPFQEEEATYHVIEGAKFVGVRDDYTRDLLASKGFPATVVADPLIGSVKGGKKEYEILTISWNAMQLPQKVCHEMNCALAAFIEAEYWLGLPSSWEPMNSFDNDCIPLREVASLAGMEVIVPYDFQEVSDYLSTTSILLTSRLHLGITAIAAGAKVVFFGQQKCKRWLDTVGMAGAYAEDYGSITVESLRKAYNVDGSKTIALRLQRTAEKSSQLFSEELRECLA